MKEIIQIWKAIADDIKEDIINGVYKPGDQLKEILLAEKYSTSKTPVREALRYLGGIGFIEIIPNKMARVITMNRKDIENLFRIHAILEGLAARDAVPNLTYGDLNKIETYVELMEKYSSENNHEEYEKINVNFHSIFWFMCDNKMLLDMIYNTYERFHRFISLPRRYPKEFNVMVPDHRKIYEAVIKKDRDEVEGLFKRHIERYKKIIFRLLEKENNL